MKITTEQRFWRKVNVAALGKCWEWRGAKLSTGYGRFNVGNGKCVYAHRFSYELTHGAIPDGMYILHACDNPKCVNPAHLFVGTAGDNASDKVKKNRQLKGESNGFSKLSDEDVRRIRDLRSAGVRSKEIAKMFGISYQHVWIIVTRKQWAHVE